MGKAIIIPGVSFAGNNLGRVTFSGTTLRSISIIGADNIGGVSTYTIAYYPTTAEHKGVTWSVLSGAATITQEGVLTPTENGTVVIQAVSTYDQTIVATSTIAVEIVIPVVSIEIYGSDSISGETQYSVIYNPSDTTQEGVTWEVVSGPATITQGGLLTPSDNGQVVIRATSTYNAQVVTTKTITVSMEIPVTSISIVGDSLISGQGTYSIAYNPSNTTQQGVTWSVVSGNATITQQGVLTASDNGEVVIQAVSTYNSQVVATKTVTVSMVIPLVSLSVVGDDVIEGETTYSVAYNPSNTTETGVTWEVVSGPATITQGGVLTPSADGEIVIRATSTQNPSISASKTVTSQYGHDYSQDYFTIESLANNNNLRVRNQDCNILPTFYYSIDDGQTWNSFTVPKNSRTVFTRLNQGEKVLVKCTTPSLAAAWNQRNFFQMDYAIRVSGNAMSLLWGDDFANHSEFAEGSSFNLCGLFWYNDNQSDVVVDASNLVLPATIATEGCYNGMFRHNLTLEKPPKMNLTTLASACCSSMYEACTSLQYHEELPVATPADECYQRMFCVSRDSQVAAAMTKTPVIRLTDTTPVRCMQQMFAGNSSLTEVTCLATTIDNTNDGIDDWLANTPAVGTFKKAAGATWPTGTNGVPTGWTVEDYVEPSNNE